MILAVVAGMIALSFASVPLYRMFCQLTGFGGTVQISGSVPAESDILDRSITVRFNADVARNMLWAFHADQRQVHGSDGKRDGIETGIWNHSCVTLQKNDFRYRVSMMAGWMG